MIIKEVKHKIYNFFRLYNVELWSYTMRILRENITFNEMEYKLLRNASTSVLDYNARYLSDINY